MAAEEAFEERARSRSPHPRPRRHEWPRPCSQSGTCLSRWIMTENQKDRNTTPTQASCCETNSSVDIVRPASYFTICCWGGREPDRLRLSRPHYPTFFQLAFLSLSSVRPCELWLVISFPCFICYIAISIFSCLRFKWAHFLFCSQCCNTRRFRTSKYLLSYCHL